MIAIITCAGKGTRRRPETNFTPKILLDYQGDPLIEHIARPIDASGCFEKIVFVLSPRTGHQIIAYLRRNPFKTAIKYVWQGKPLGFGHAVLQAKQEVLSWTRINPLRAVRPGPVLIHTDDAVNSHYRREMSLVKQIVSKGVSTIGVQWRGNVREHGMVIVGESREARKRVPTFGIPRIGRCEEARKKPTHLPRHNSPSRVQVERLVEKPYWDDGGLCMTGIYFIRESRRLFRCLNKLVQGGRCLGGEFQFTHALQMMIDGGTPFETYYHEWIDAGKREDVKT